MTPAQYAGILAALGSSPGIMLPFAGVVAPSGFLLCNGDAVSRSTFGALFAIIGTTFGNGDGSTTFNIPDCRSRFVVGAGQSGGLTNYVLGSGGGNESQTLLKANLPSITLDATVDTNVPVNGGNNAIQGSSNSGSPSTVVNAVSLGGSDTPVATVPPFLALNWLIKT